MIENIVSLDQRDRSSLLRAIEHSQRAGTRLRICTGEDSRGKWIKWDPGYGWTPPYYGLPE